MSTQTMNEKDVFLNTNAQEFAITMKLLANYPAGKETFKPAEKSREARELVWTFMMEEQVGQAAFAGPIEVTGPPPAPTVSIAEIVKMYEKSHTEFVAKLKATPESRLNETIKFPVGPKQLGDVRVGDVMWLMLMDHTHHRGQLSVYMRILGAKIPAIYGPSGDEPWM
jgi:hypothetical protein